MYTGNVQSTSLNFDVQLTYSFIAIFNIVILTTNKYLYQPHNYLYYNVQFGVQIYINPTESRKHFSFGNDELTSGEQKINFTDWICRSLPYSRNIDNRFRIKYRLIRKIQSGLAFSLSQSAEFKGSHVKDDILKTVSRVKFDVDDGPAILF